MYYGNDPPTLIFMSYIFVTTKMFFFIQNFQIHGTQAINISQDNSMFSPG